MQAPIDRSETDRIQARPDGFDRLHDRGWRGELAQVRLRALFALPLLALFLLGGRAEACPLTNPNCAVDQTTKTVEETVESAPPVENVTEKATDTANETVDTVEETVTDTTEDVTETVEETLNPGGGSVDNPTPPEEPREPGPGGNREPNRNGPGEGGERVKGQDQLRSGAGDPVLDRSLRPDGDPPVLDGSVVRTSSENKVAEDEDGLAESVLEAAKDFAFPLALTLIVGTFLALQHRFDRRDPKLALAPVAHDYLSFE